MNEKVSVIIPIYNSEKYLNRCLQSIEKQTYKNIEILLIDDGSTDNSQKICNKYIEKDNRFYYFYENNSGVSNARNLGIEKANGKYVVFIDSDDYVDEKFIELMIEKAIDKDLVCVSYNQNQKIDRTIVTKEEFLINLFNNRFGYQGYVWNKLFTKSIIMENNIRFDSTIFYNEDRLFVFEYTQSIKKDIYFLKELLYYYQLTESSAMNKSYNKKMNTEFFAFEKMKNSIENESIKKWIDYEIYHRACYCYRKYRNDFYKKYIELKNLFALLIKNKYGLKKKLKLIKSRISIIF